MFFYCNARSLKNKLNHLNYLTNLNYHILGFTETWLNSSIENYSLLANSDYAIFRTDRKTKGGCVAIFVKSDLLPILLDSFIIQGINLLTVLVYNVCIILVYIPPKFVHHTEGHKHILITGDFNFPNINWSNPSLTCTTTEDMFTNFVQYCHCHN